MVTAEEPRVERQFNPCGYVPRLRDLPEYGARLARFARSVTLRAGSAGRDARRLRPGRRPYGAVVRRAALR